MEVRPNGGSWKTKYDSNKIKPSMGKKVMLIQ